MDDLLMQIEVIEKKLNRVTSYDNIIDIKLKNGVLFIEDDIGFKAGFHINYDIEMKINFYSLSGEILC